MKVKFLPMNTEVEIQPEQTVLQVALQSGIPIRSVCKGVPSCAECRVKIVEGDQLVLPPNKAELNLIGSGYFVDHRRLSCQLHCFGDVTLDLTEQVEKANETPLRKIRGNARKIMSGKSQAVQDTYLLKEGAAAELAESGSEEDETESN